MRRPHLPRPRMVMLPNGLTLANLFCGIYAIVLAARGDLSYAGGLIILGGVFDAMDGRIARATGTGSRFGEELDSLVDAISFGLAPALLMYFAVLNNKDGWDWVFVFLYTAFATMRLARFNVEQAGRAKQYFHGLPSPAAGITLASYYWFSQTSIYNHTIIGNWPWTNMVRVLMVVLGFLMISNVPYLAWPTFSVKTLRGFLGLVAFIGLGVGLVFLPKEFFFPVGLFYVLGFLAIAAVRGLFDRKPIFRGSSIHETASEYGDGMDDFDDDDVSPYLEDDDDIEYDVPVSRPATSAATPFANRAPAPVGRSTAPVSRPVPPASRPAHPGSRPVSPVAPPGAPAGAAAGADAGAPESSADAQRKRRRRRRSRGGRGRDGGGNTGGTTDGAPDSGPPMSDHDSHQDAPE